MRLAPYWISPRRRPDGSCSLTERTIGFSADGIVLAELDGRYLSTEVAGGFTGRVIGMYVTEGRAAFDWFDYVPDPGAGDHGE